MRNGKITLSFTDMGKSYICLETWTSQICLLTLFAKIKFSRKIPNLQYPILSFMHESTFVPQSSMDQEFHYRKLEFKDFFRSEGSSTIPMCSYWVGWEGWLVSWNRNLQNACNCHANINNLWYSYMYLILIGRLRQRQYIWYSVSVKFKIVFRISSNICCWYTLTYVFSIP